MPPPANDTHAGTQIHTRTQITHLSAQQITKQVSNSLLLSLTVSSVSLLQLTWLPTKPYDPEKLYQKISREILLRTSVEIFGIRNGSSSSDIAFVSVSCICICICWRRRWGSCPACCPSLSLFLLLSARLRIQFNFYLLLFSHFILIFADNLQRLQKFCAFFNDLKKEAGKREKERERDERERSG